jgi:hypothetical protein
MMEEARRLLEGEKSEWSEIAEGGFTYRERRPAGL